MADRYNRTQDDVIATYFSLHLFHTFYYEGISDYPRIPARITRFQ